MDLWEELAVGIVTAFWVAVDVTFVLDPYLADWVAADLRISRDALEIAVFLLGCLASWGAHKAAELGE
jgi:hypothetical protein